MVLIDKKGKLLGLINIIDLIVIMLVVALVTGGAYKLVLSERAVGEEDRLAEVVLEVVISEVRQATVDIVAQGDKLQDATIRQHFGEIIDLEVKPFRIPVETREGKVVMAEVPERYDIHLTIAGTGRISRDAIRVASFEVLTGSRIHLRTRYYSVVATVLKVEVVE